MTRALSRLTVAIVVVLCSQQLGVADATSGRMPPGRAPKVENVRQPHIRSNSAVKTPSSRFYRTLLRSSHRSRARHLTGSFNRPRAFTAQERLLDEWKIRSIDGDTFAYGSERIRIVGIDTPEVSEAGGFEAARRLEQLLHEGPVSIVPKSVDLYGRTLAEVYVDHQNVAKLLASEGYAKTR